MTFSGHNDSTINIVLGLLLLLYSIAGIQRPFYSTTQGRRAWGLGCLDPWKYVFFFFR